MMISTENPTLSELKKFETFVNMTAHELKTPVSVLKAYLQMISRELEKAKLAGFITTLEKMDAQLNKLLHLISDLQDGMTPHSEGIHCLMNDLSVNNFLKLCAQDAVATHPELQIELSLDVSQPVIKADRERIEQVIHNLINNAVKYSGNHKYVLLSSKIQKKKVTISVKDNGFGIPAAQQSHVFDQFYRINHPSAAARQPEGLGLGLFICTEIVRKHGGEIWVNSEEGLGSEFSFSLPIFSGA